MDELPDPPAVDLLAFVVEGHGTFLVPLGAITRYRIEDDPTDATPNTDGLGWGWRLPVVRWNSFDVRQVDRRITLAPGVVARIDPELFGQGA